MRLGYLVDGFTVAGEERHAVRTATGSSAGAVSI
jgi:hypothetical protein